MKPVLIIWLCYCMALISVKGQPDTGFCQNDAFDSHLKGLLTFSVPIISVVELDSTYNKYLVLDAREKEEFNVSRLPGATHIGYNFFNPKSLDGVDKTQPIVVYCSVGYRSEKIAERLKLLGYTEVYNLYGSIFEWANRGFKIESPEGQATERLHAYNKKWSKWIDNPNILKTW